VEIQDCQVLPDDFRGLKQKRLNFSLEMLRNKETFSNVLFTDETSVEMNSSGSVFFTKRGPQPTWYRDRLQNQNMRTR